MDDPKLAAEIATAKTLCSSFDPAEVADLMSKPLDWVYAALGLRTQPAQVPARPGKRRRKKNRGKISPAEWVEIWKRYDQRGTTRETVAEIALAFDTSITHLYNSATIRNKDKRAAAVRKL